MIIPKKVCEVEFYTKEVRGQLKRLTYGTGADYQIAAFKMFVLVF